MGTRPWPWGAWLSCSAGTARNTQARRRHGVADGKNYYRFAGLFIGLHKGLIRSLGESAAYANIVGNPLVYAGAEVVQWWGEFFRTRRAPSKQVDTLRTLGPTATATSSTRSRAAQRHAGRRQAARQSRHQTLSPGTDGDHIGCR